MSDKMRERFEKWALTECFDLTSVGGFYSDNETHAAYIAWQAAQSVSVPVAGDVVAWVRWHPDGALSSEFIADDIIEPIRRNSGAWLPMIIQPTTSITAAELDALRERISQLESERFTVGYVEYRKQLLHEFTVRAQALCDTQGGDKVTWPEFVGLFSELVNLSEPGALN